MEQVEDLFYIERIREANEIDNWLTALAVRNCLLGYDHNVKLETLRASFNIQYIHDGVRVLDIDICGTSYADWKYCIDVHSFRFIGKLIDKRLKHSNIYIETLDKLWEYLEVIFEHERITRDI